MMASCPNCPKLNEINQRAFYMGGAALLYGGLSTTLVGVFNAAKLDAAGEPIEDTYRYQECALEGATSTTACVAPSDAQKDQNQTIFNIAIASMVLNFSMVLALLLTMSSTRWTGMLFRSQMVYEAINVGLFAGIVGWLNMSENLLVTANVENNVFFNEVNPFAVAVVGLVLAILDTAVFNGLRMCYFKGRCDISAGNK